MHGGREATIFKPKHSFSATLVLDPPASLELPQLIPLNLLCIHAQSLSSIQLFVTPWTAVHKAPLSMGFYRQEYWNRLSFISPGDSPDPGIQPTSVTSPGLAVRFFTTSATWKVPESAELCPICRSVNQATDCCFKTLSSGVVFCTTIDKQNKPKLTS